MSKSTKHEKAYYFSGGNKIEILSKDLDDNKVYLKAKSEILTDETGYTLLRPRQCSSKTSHFYAPNNSDTRKVALYEDNNPHNIQVNYLLKKLGKENSLKIGNTIFENGKAIGFSPIVNLNSHSWKKEVHRIYNHKLTVRHDIFGQSVDLAMSVRSPWVAIEVINTHFPSDETFSAMLDLSKQMPLLIMFDLITEKTKNYFIKIDLHNGTIIPIFYIYEGSVWYGDNIDHEITNPDILKYKMTESEKKLKNLKSREIN